jgi:hypothetical protein
MRIGVMREYMDKKKFDIIDHGAKKLYFLSHLYIKKGTFYQDRLGTNIGKVEQRVAFFAENIDLVDQAIATLADLGATIVEPDAKDNGLMTPSLRKYLLRPILV